MGITGRHCIRNRKSIGSPPLHYVHEADLMPSYSVLMQWKFKTGISAAPRKPPLGPKVTGDIAEAGFALKDYSLTYWSGDSDGWRVYEGGDLEKLEQTIKELRYDQNLDKWMDVKFSVGRCSGPPYATLEADPPRIKAGEERSTVTVALHDPRFSRPDYDFVPLDDGGRSHSFTFTIVGDPTGVELVDAPDGEVNAPSATFVVGIGPEREQGHGDLKIFVGIDDETRGLVVPIGITF